MLRTHLLRAIPINPRVTQFTLLALFLSSGVSALIYQIMWQRLLFTLLGVDLQSVTVIVSVFMFGLGIGGLLGGLVADFYAKNLLMLYALIEFCIAVFGMLSSKLIVIISNLMLANSAFAVAAVSFMVLAIPTILMGATFPILVTHINRKVNHIGTSVGYLYFANTLGGALGAYYAGFILLHSLTITEAIHSAAWLNLAIGLTALLIFRGDK